MTAILSCPRMRASITHLRHARACGHPSPSVVHFDLMMLQLNHSGASQDFQQDSDAFAGDTLNQPFNTAQSRVFEAHGLAGLEVAKFLKGGVVAVLFELADALHEVVVERGGLEAKAHDGGDAFGAAHGRNALLGFAWSKQDVAREHGLEQRDGALLGFFEFFVQRQIGFKVLLLQVGLGDSLFAGLGVGQVPAVGWRAFQKKLVWRWRVLGHSVFAAVSVPILGGRMLAHLRARCSPKQNPACAGLSAWAKKML